MKILTRLWNDTSGVVNDALFVNRDAESFEAQVIDLLKDIRFFALVIIVLMVAS